MSESSWGALVLQGVFGAFYSTFWWPQWPSRGSLNAWPWDNRPRSKNEINSIGVFHYTPNTWRGSNEVDVCVVVLLRS
eukprot:9492703-Pyramimonas_sp.AAC.1